jgi:hypothetical protein
MLYFSCFIVFCVICIVIFLWRPPAEVQYVVPFEDCVYLNWQAEVLLYNFTKLGIADRLWFSILYAPGAGGPSSGARKLARIHDQTKLYENDNNHWREYKPICKSYGAAKLLEEYPGLGKRMFLMDTDMLLREPIDFGPMLRDSCFYGSDTRSYLSYSHFHDDRGVTEEQMARITGIVGLPVEEYRRAEGSIIGAQYLFKDVDAAFFRKVAADAWELHKYALELQKAGSALQVWVLGDMGSFLLNCLLRKGVRGTKATPLLDFAWATDPIKRFGETSMCHMAGVVHAGATMFDKQRYSQVAPWEDGAGDFSYITNKTTCAHLWYEIVREYAAAHYNVRI